ncbi:DNA-binding GntR family transcriptional regulator [Microvirga flocculans]|uniref:DNA-binding GntR family transcriptional regulator n=1 Tax=Microvirga flocculans TaxID=217168 RepID=A0A7W6IIK8_9HYPH|nr:GntR family transcriptional regulator [Microvirga flocculans]MBB4042170.1 DNA-binding GntR family transcriptional regulator [Microvirga flocculans]
MADPLTSTRGQAAYRCLREMILDGTFPPETPLQENMLAARLGVSRTPIREALAQLLNEGLIARVSGLTPVVKRLSVDDFVEILHMRRLLEVEAAGRAARSSGTAVLRPIRERMMAFVAGEQPTDEEHAALDDQLHAAIASLSGSRLLTRYVTDLRLKTKMFDRGRLPERLVPGSQEHVAIIDAILAGQPEQAQEAMCTHLNNVRASILAYLGRLT